MKWDGPDRWCASRPPAGALASSSRSTPPTATSWGSPRALDHLAGADADALIARAQALGLRVIVDWVPSHTSDRHPVQSSRSAISAAVADLGGQQHDVGPHNLAMRTSYPAPRADATRASLSSMRYLGAIKKTPP